MHASTRGPAAAAALLALAALVTLAGAATAGVTWIESGPAGDLARDTTTEAFEPVAKTGVPAAAAAHADATVDDANALLAATLPDAVSVRLDVTPATREDATFLHPYLLEPGAGADINDRYVTPMPLLVLAPPHEAFAPTFEASVPVESHAMERGGSAPVPELEPTASLAAAASAPPPARAPEPPTLATMASAGVAAAREDAPGSTAEAVAIAALLLAPLAPLLAAALARISPDRVLEHPRRARIHAILKAEPGRTRGEIATRLGIHWSRADYHIGRLARAGVIVRSGRRHFVAGATTGVATPAALDTPAARAVVAAVATFPGPLAAVSRRAGLAPQLCQYHLRRLAAAGIVLAEGEGRGRVYRAAPSMVAQSA